MPTAPRSRYGHSARGRRGKFSGWTATAAASLVLTTGCSTSALAPHSTGQAAPQQQSFARYSSAAALLVQCAVSNGSRPIVRSAQRYNASLPQNLRWLAGDQVELTKANGSGFTDWFQDGGGAVKLSGKQFGYWQTWAADHDQLPTQVCGTAVTGSAIRQIYAQVYAQLPTLRSQDPW